MANFLSMYKNRYLAENNIIDSTDNPFDSDSEDVEIDFF